MQIELQLKSGYKAFKIFQAKFIFKQNPQLCLYKVVSLKVWSYDKPDLPYQDRKHVDCNICYLNHSQKPY